MNRTIRRALTVGGATIGTLALTTGTAFAHYCYRTDVPEGSNMSKGGAWSTKAEALSMFPAFLPDGPCEVAVLSFMQTLPEHTLFMGPGLLAGGAVRNGNGPEGFGHVVEYAMTVPECAPPSE